MGNKTKIVDDGNSGKYFFQIPNLIDDFELSVYAFRLYAHLKRVVGENGICWQSTRTLANSCKIGVASVSRAKTELLKAGLIVITEKPSDNGRRPYHEIKLVDIWKDNFDRYAPKVSSPGEQASSKEKQPSSTGELASSEGELKKIESLRISLEEALKTWSVLFPDKPQPRPTTSKIKKDWRIRMKDKHFREHWKEALETASRNAGLQAESWFDFYHFISNETNYQRCLDNFWDWKHNKHISDNDNNQQVIDEIYPLYTDQ